VVAVIGNPIVVDDFPFSADKDDYVLWIGRMNADKGPNRAIAAAREADVRLVLAGPVQPGQEEFFAREVEPHIDGESVEYIGEVGEEKSSLYAGAGAFLMPIRWPEPFGLVMTEAMACGTPVIAFPEGSAPEIVLDGETGFVVDDEHAMADAIGRLDEIDPERCRESARERFDVAAVAEAYERAYEVVSSRSPAG
jgi:glycosyltransferase involved in cell wall biosynthesis